MRTLLILLLAGLLLGSAVPAMACTTPVYRWALENWPPDPYELVVFHAGGVSEAQQAVIDNLYPLAETETPLNLAVHVVDLATIPAEQLPPWYPEVAAGEAQAVLRYPFASPLAPPIWSTPLHEALPEQLQQSPVRKAIVDKLCAGDAAVWVLMESGNEEADAKARETLDTILPDMPAMLEQVQRNVIEAQYESDIDIPPVSFSVITMARQDEKEALLHAMLVHSEVDLQEYADAPLLFPVFGCGRTLYALVGAGINEATIREACVYIGTACTCTVKDDNPGLDLLLAADWRIAVEALPEMPEPDPETLKEVVPPEEMIVEDTAGISTLLVAAIVVVIAFLALSSLTLIVSRRRK